MYRIEFKACRPLRQFGLARPGCLEDTITSKDELPLQQEIPKILFRFNEAHTIIVIAVIIGDGAIAANTSVSSSSGRKRREGRPEVSVSLQEGHKVLPFEVLDPSVLQNCPS